MKIARISLTHHRLPLEPPFQAAWDGRPRTHFDATLVRVETDEGHVGVGSGDLMLGFAGHEELFVGQDPLALERHHRVLANLSFHYGRSWPLDLALWDLAGKIRGAPCYHLLGGGGNRVRAYASMGVLREAKAAAETARRLLEEGFKAMKIRVARQDPRKDLEVVEAVRAEVGGALTLMVDCNQGWRMPWDTASPWSLEEAVRVAEPLEELGVYWMEEPLDRADYDGMAALRRATRVLIAGGEMNREAHEFHTLVDKGCLDVLQPDAALAGGITGARRVALMAREHDLVFSPHTWTNGIGLLANAHLAAGVGGVPFLEYAYDPPHWTAKRRDFMLAEPVRVDDDGWLVLGDAPGLGVVLDEDRLRATAVT